MSHVPEPYNENRRNRFLIAAYFFVLLLVYAALFFPPFEGVSFDEINRSIDPPFRAIFNKYLGSLFYFKYLGGLVWIILPGILVLAYRRRFSYTHTHLLWIVPIMLMFGFIALKANINYRYHLTLFPLFTAISFWFLSMIFKEETLRTKVFQAILLLQVFNTSLFLVVDFYPRYQKRIAKTIAAKQTTAGVFDYMNAHLGIDDKVYVDNLPEFFVHTQHQGLFGWSGNREYYDIHGKHAFPVDIGANSLRKMLADTLHCNYFLVHEQLKNYRGGFQAFLDEQTTCTFADSAGYRLHLLNAEP
jgi:diacylglycerol kinase